MPILPRELARLEIDVKGATEPYLIPASFVCITEKGVNFICRQTVDERPSSLPLSNQPHGKIVTKTVHQLVTDIIFGKRINTRAISGIRVVIPDATHRVEIAKDWAQRSPKYAKVLEQYIAAIESNGDESKAWKCVIRELKE